MFKVGFSYMLEEDSVSSQAGRCGRVCPLKHANADTICHNMSHYFCSGLGVGNKRKGWELEFVVESKACGDDWLKERLHLLDNHSNGF